ncbi:MAG TPA: helix-turn-helix domain-containing protein, partial [Victivallales bacterium]|nr:helix-turn-helix domain-containing protein [Victivallales bacterium]
PLLIAYILKKMHLQTGEDTKDISVSEESLNAMMDYNWPGNIRELQNWIQFALIKCGDDKVIRLEHLPIFNDTESINLYKTSKNKRKRKLSHDAVHKALEEANGNKVKAAKILGVGRATLYRFLE